VPEFSSSAVAGSHVHKLSEQKRGAGRTQKDVVSLMFFTVAA